ETDASGPGRKTRRRPGARRRTGRRCRRPEGWCRPCLVLIKGARSFTLDYIMVERVVVGPWKTNCYIYSSTKKECIIIDPGGSDEEIASRVDVLNMVPVGIALTHGHVD